jgi:hypothetical protein
LPAPSRRVAQLARPELEAIPPELDALVLALLSTNEFARPNSAAEVIDRIDALLGDARPDESEGAEVRLNNVAFVARVPERRRLKRLFTLAAHGRGQACVIESAPGGGRSRGLKELGLAARVAHATVLHANAVDDDGALYGTANVLALALLDALPERALAAAAPHAALLAHVSPRLRHRLVATPAPLSEVAGELRVQVQEALRAWFMALAVEQPLVVLVDGLERVDDGSTAFLLALVLGCRSARILLACALVRERTREHSLVLRALIKASHRLVVPML